MPVLGVLESGLTTGLETLPKVYPGAFNGQRERGVEDRQEDPLAVHCFCVAGVHCSGMNLRGVSRSMECDIGYPVFIPGFL